MCMLSGHKFTSAIVHMMEGVWEDLINSSKFLSDKSQTYQSASRTQNESMKGKLVAMDWNSLYVM